MNSELTSAPRTSRERQGNYESDVQRAASRKISRRQTTSSANTNDILAQFKKDTLTGFWGFLQLPRVRYCILGIFTVIVMTVAILVVYFSTLPSNEPCQFAFQRTMKSTVVSSSQPRSVAVGDINNDQQIDFVVANPGQNNIGIFISTGNETFVDQQTYSTGSDSRPHSVVLSDFNNDTYLDIGVANYGTNNIGIFLGNENGTFANQKLFSLDSSRPVFVSVADFNNDDIMDIVVATNGTNNISILFGNGDGTFQNHLTYFTGYDSMPYSLAVGDFNKDGQLDIAVANYGTSNVCIFLNYGNGTFKIQQTYTTTLNSNPSSIAVGDFNDDNQLDIVVANSGTSDIGILFGRSNGSFLTQETYTIGRNAEPQYVTVYDLNKDNQLDIIIVDPKNDQVHVLQGSGNGRFTTISTFDGIFGSQPCWVALSDFNNNDQSDMVVVNYATGNALLLIDYSIEPSTRQKNYVGTPGATGLVAISDFNNDHILDIVFNTDEDLIILTGLGDGIFSSIATFSIRTGLSPQYMCVADLNNDNQTDIIITDINSNSIYVYLGHGDGTFATMTAYSTGDDSTPYWVAVGDVNNDNHMDIISANRGTSMIAIFLGNGDGTFSTMITYSTGTDSFPVSVAVGDINNDIYLDIVIGTDTDVLIVFIGYGNGSFINWGTYYTIANSGTTTIVLADFNSDNYLDIAISSLYANCIGIFLGYGNGTFTTQTVYSTGFGSSPINVMVADFNNDNISDIATTNFGTDGMVIFYGYGNGIFELARIYSTGSGSKPYGITAADLDNNKQLEIVVGLWGTGDVAVLTEYYAADFVNELKYSTGSTLQPYSVVVGDFNKDNRSDIVVANAGNGSLGILFGLNNGTFDMGMIYTIGTDSYPQYVISYDINKDNYLDLVSVNSKNNSISVIMGYGNGSFAEQMMYPTGDDSHPYSVVAGDFNNDTWLDLVVANEGTDSIGILFGFNYTTFQNQVPYTSDYSQGPTVVVVADFNNDNYLDIAVTFNRLNGLGILLGYGNGSFMDIQAYWTGIASGPWGIAADDFNKDNNTDLVVANTATNTIDIFLGYGDGSFDYPITYATGENSFPLAVAIGDFNNDSQLDIVVANYGSNTVVVLCGYGNGSFFVVQLYSTGQDSAPSSVTVADLNNDGQLDIVVANYQTDNVGILFGYGNGTFQDQITFSVGDQSRPIWVIIGDFNSDNQTDIATANFNLNNVGILLGYGNGSFTNVKAYSTGAGSLPSCLNLGDFNNDNIPDIAVTNVGTNDFVVLFGVGDGSFLLGTPYSTGTGAQPFTLANGNFDNDTRLDVVVANSHSDDIRVFLGYGSEPFASVTTYNIGAGSQPHLMATDDLNNDGLLDIVIANYGTDNVGVLLGSSNEIFNSMIPYPTGSGSAPYSVGIADFNNDTYLDIIVTNSGTDNVAVLFGYGDGTFEIGRSYSTGADSHPYTVTIGDFNHDNILDLAVANSGTSKIFLLYGYRNGTFGNGTSYAFGYDYSPYSVVASDLNQDNSMDIVIACHGSDHIETLMKLCS